MSIITKPDRLVWTPPERDKTDLGIVLPPFGEGVARRRGQAHGEQAGTLEPPSGAGLGYVLGRPYSRDYFPEFNRAQRRSLKRRGDRMERAQRKAECRKFVPYSIHFGPAVPGAEAKQLRERQRLHAQMVRRMKSYGMEIVETP